MKVVLASGNKGKLKEFQAILADSGLDLAPMSNWPEIGEIEETGATFLENSRLKARTVSETTGLPALADDSGLTVEALNGAPGVYSARYSGEGATDEANYRLLLDNLAETPDNQRQAAFVAVLVLHYPDGREETAEGRCEGVINWAPQGENGFGYDPVFFLPDLGRTMAQLSPDQKNEISHRAQAARKLNEKLKTKMQEKRPKP